MKLKSHSRKSNERENGESLEPKGLGRENKRYYDQLESEVISLRKENHKLRLIIEQYKAQSFQELSQDSKLGISSDNNYKSLLKNTFFEEEKGDNKDEIFSKQHLKNILDTKGKNNFDNVLNMVEKSFMLIINNLLPSQFWRHLESVDKKITMSLSQLNEFKKMPKIQKADYVIENGVTHIEEKLSEMELNDFQYEFIQSSLLPAEWQNKNNFRKGLRLLWEAKQILCEAMIEQFSMRHMITHSDILTTKQVALYYIKELIIPLDEKCDLWELFEIHQERKQIIFNLSENKYFTPFVEHYMDPDESTFTVNITQLSFKNEIREFKESLL